MKELKSKIIEALISALPITAIVYLLSLTPWFNFSGAELITFTVGAVMLVLGIGLFNMGADLAMTPIGTHVGSGLSRQKNLPLLLGACFGLGLLITVAEPADPRAEQPGGGSDRRPCEEKIHAHRPVHRRRRGVVNEDAAAFFGITLHADKEILMMVVEKDIRDDVLNAIYKEMGMDKKAKGIAFSLPVSDVAGLIQQN
ncbi:MAG: DUF1538 family protein [Oscillospiraceae bacterium]|nr:DUF1538 family protein [Oscillospiraceae bacterium]